MSGLRAQVRLFGFDGSHFLSDIALAWRYMLAWPMFAWLSPKLNIRLWLPTGQTVSSHGPGTPRRAKDHKLKAARFDAVLLPEYLLLRRELSMPALQSQDMLAALGLQVAGLSPFPAEDLVWTYETEPRTSTQENTLRVHLVMVSRRLVISHILQNHSGVHSDAVEVWAPSALTGFDVMLPGFGESTRLHKTVVWYWIHALLVSLVLATLAAMAVTPTVQLYLRARQAHDAMTALQAKAVPVLQQRETLVRSTEQLASLTGIVGQSVSPLRVLKLVTDALPDDTSLLSLQVQGHKVTLIGQTKDATALMKQLGTTPGLRDVTAPTPAIKPLGATRESFSIEFMLDPAQLKSAQIPPVK